MRKTQQFWLRCRVRRSVSEAEGRPGCRGTFCSITSTAVYTALAPNRFKDFWRE